MADLKIIDDDEAMAEIEEERKRIKELYAKRQAVNERRKRESKTEDAPKSEIKESVKSSVKAAPPKTEEDFFKYARTEFEKNFEKKAENKDKKKPKRTTEQSVKRQAVKTTKTKDTRNTKKTAVNESLSEEELIKMVRNQMGKGRYAAKNKAKARM